MERKKVVIALGGNAIQSGDASAKAQQLALEKTAEQLATLVENGMDIIISQKTISLQKLTPISVSVKPTST